MGIGAAVGGVIASGLGIEAGIGTTIAGGLLAGAGTGALSSAITGGDPLRGALMGGVMGGATAGIGSAFGGAADAGSALDSVDTSLSTAGADAIGPGAGITPYSSSMSADFGSSASGLDGGLGSNAAGLTNGLFTGIDPIGSDSIPNGLFTGIDRIGSDSIPNGPFIGIDRIGSDSLTNGLFTGMNDGGGGVTAPTTGGDGAGAGTAATSTSGDTLGNISKAPLSTSSYLNQQTGPLAGDSASSAASIGSVTKGLGKTADSGGILNWLMKNPQIAGGVLGLGSNLLGGGSKLNPSQVNATYAAAAGNQNPNAFSNVGLATSNPNAGMARSQVVPATSGPFNTNPSGVMPTYFANNSLAGTGYGQYGHAKGGPIRSALSHAHHPQTPTEGHVKGPGSGISDDVPAMLSNDEYVLTARDVSTIGGGSSEEGARRLDNFRRQLHKTANKGQYLNKRVEGALDRFSQHVGAER